MILQALDRHSGNQGQAARQLGISTRTLRRKLERYRMSDHCNYKITSLGTLNELQQRYYRVNVETPVLITDSRGGQAQAISVNVSCGGIAIRGGATLERGAVFELEFALPGMEAQFQIKAKLAWTSPGGSGMGFVDLHPALEQQLRRWVLERAQLDGWTASELAGG